MYQEGSHVAKMGPSSKMGPRKQSRLRKPNPSGNHHPLRQPSSPQDPLRQPPSPQATPIPSGNHHPLRQPSSPQETIIPSGNPTPGHHPLRQPSSPQEPKPSGNHNPLRQPSARDITQKPTSVAACIHSSSNQFVGIIQCDSVPPCRAGRVTITIDSRASSLLERSPVL